MSFERRTTRQLFVGKVPVGGGAPITVQSRLAVSNGLTLINAHTRGELVKQWRQKPDKQPGQPDNQTPAVFCIGR